MNLLLIGLYFLHFERETDVMKDSSVSNIIWICYNKSMPVYKGDTMDSSIVGLKIKELRLKRNMTQTELADALSVAGSTISNWEKGRRLPSISDLKRIAQYFSVSLSFFELASNNPSEANQTTTRSLFEHNQIIDYRPLGFKTDAFEPILFAIGLVTLLMSPFLPEVLRYALYFLGLLSISWSIGSLIIKRQQVYKLNSKRIQLPMTYRIYYVQQDQTNKKGTLSETFLMSESMMIVMLEILTVTSALLIFLALENVVVNMILSLYAFIAIVESAFRLRAYKTSLIREKKIDYHQAFSFLNDKTLFLSLLTDIFGLVLVTGLSVIYANDISLSLPFVLMLALYLINVSVTYASYIAFNNMSSTLVLCSIDKNGSMTKLI